MTEFDGKTVVISGGAEGIGLGLARVLGGHGMNVVLADINVEQLNIAEQILRDLNIPVLAVRLDVVDMEQWRDVAQQAVERFGKVHMLINNAGVGGTAGGVEGADEKEWRWVVDVNLMGVAFGAQAMVPLIKSHGEGGWVINVASMAGFGPLPLAGPYTATKAAVVAMTECWQPELAADNIKASVLCPGFVKTRIHESGRNKQADYGGKGGEGGTEAGGDAAGGDMGGAIESVVTTGMDATVVAQRVVEAMRDGELYIFTHPNYRPSVKARWQAVDAAFERAEQSPLLAGDVVPDLPFAR